MKRLKRIKQIFAGLVVFFLLQALFCVSDITGSAISFYEYGIDVSSYQGEIDWAQLKTEDEKLSFAIIRDLQIKVKPQFSEFTNNSQDKKWHDKKAASNLKKEAA